MDIGLAVAVFGVVIFVALIFTCVLRYVEFKSVIKYLKSDIKRSAPGLRTRRHRRRKYRGLMVKYRLFF